MIIDRLNLVIGIIAVITGIFGMYEAFTISFSNGKLGSFTPWYFLSGAIVLGGERIYTALKQ